MSADIKQLILEVLEKGYLMSLATVDSGGVWVCDVIYIFDENLNIYWMSKDFRRHSKAIEINQNVAGTITVSANGEDNLGIQFSGVAARIEEARYDLVEKFYTKKNKPTSLETEDFLKGHTWYQLKPQKIELINEKLFEFEKQKLEL